MSDEESIDSVLQRVFVQPANMTEAAARWERERLAPYEAAVRRCKGMPSDYEAIAAEYSWFPKHSLPVVLKVLQENEADFRSTIAKLKPSPFATPIVTLIGKTGAGKTTAAFAMFLLYMQAWRTFLIRQAEERLEAARAGASPAKVSKPMKPMFVVAKDIIDARRFSPLGSEPELLERARASSFVIIDDIVGMPDREQDLYRVVWDRDGYKLPTIITTAMSPEEMTSSYSEMFTRRVFGGTSKLITRKP